MSGKNEYMCVTDEVSYYVGPKKVDNILQVFLFFSQSN